MATTTHEPKQLSNNESPSFKENSRDGSSSDGVQDKPLANEPGKEGTKAEVSATSAYSLHWLIFIHLYGSGLLKSLSLLDRYLPILILLAMIMGALIGVYKVCIPLLLE